MLILKDVAMIQGAFHLAADVAIRSHAITAVMGPSGAGKSTCLAAIAGFLPVQRGEITFDGSAIHTMPPSERPYSIVFQDGNLFPHMTVLENVALGLNPSLKLTDSEMQQIKTSLEHVGLSGFGARKPGALSGGQQSRVALARVLLRNRPLMLLDEPFAALGPGLKAEMLDLVKQIASAQGLTVLMVTHDPGDVARIADQIALVADGRVHAPLQTDALLSNPPPALKEYLG